MSKKNSQKKYEELKAYYKNEAKDLEKQLHMDLVAVRHEYVPHHLKSKFLTGVAIFGSMYLAEKLLFGKKVPRIIRFTTSLSAIIWAPKVYQKLHDKVTGIGEQEPVEMEMMEDELELGAQGYESDYYLEDFEDELIETERELLTTTEVEEEIIEETAEQEEELNKKDPLSTDAFKEDTDTDQKDEGKLPPT